MSTATPTRRRGVEIVHGTQETVVLGNRVTPHLFAICSGMPIKKIDANIREGVWREGFEYHRDGSGEVLIDRAGVQDWILSGKPAAPSAPEEPAQPVRTALYRHFGADGVLLYVGISLNAIARQAAHAMQAHWHQDIARISIEWFESREAALAEELRAIRSEKPRHNIAGVE